MCAKQGNTKAARIVDHVEPHRGDQLRFYTSELQSLCKHCHDSHKQRQEKSGKQMGCDAQGNPIGGWLS
jgi:5-methylcytosine-specific restriction enzyme A